MFIATGDGKSQFEFKPNNFFFKKGNSRDLVLVGNVTSGVVTAGDPVILSSLIECKKETIRGTITRMELQKKEITEAKEGMEIGICIPGVRIKELRNIRRTNKMKLYQS